MSSDRISVPIVILNTFYLLLRGVAAGCCGRVLQKGVLQVPCVFYFCTVADAARSRTNKEKLTDRVSF